MTPPESFLALMFKDLLQVPSSCVDPGEMMTKTCKGAFQTNKFTELTFIE